MGCEIEGRPGIILVEAKANVPELSIAGKPLDSNASAASVENHQRIGLAVNETCAQLQRISAATAISRDSHYQLSNRVAFAWKLASLGVPSVLVYLGFSGDDGIADAGTPFTDSSHWKEVFAAYAHSVVPKDLFERRIDCGAAPAWFLVRSRPVIEASPPRRQQELAVTIEATSRTPADCSEADVAAFCKLVREGGQVRTVGLEGRVKSAKTLVFLLNGPTLAGTAAIKVPTLQHKRNVFERAHVSEIQQDFNLELGYVVVAEQYRDRKLSRVLMEKALDGVGTTPLFATSRSDRQWIHSTLARFSFVRVGDPYPSEEEEGDVLLFVRGRSNRDAVAEGGMNDGAMQSTKPNITSCAYLGVDVTDRFSNEARQMDVCGLESKGDNLVAHFWTWCWGPSDPIGVSAILPEVREARAVMIDGPQGLAQIGRSLRSSESAGRSGVFKPLEPVDLAEHTEVDVSIPAPIPLDIADATGWKAAEALIGFIEDALPDMAEQHDAYLHAGRTDARRRL